MGGAEVGLLAGAVLDGWGHGFGPGKGKHGLLLKERVHPVWVR